MYAYIMHLFPRINSKSFQCSTKTINMIAVRIGSYIASTQILFLTGGRRSMGAKGIPPKLKVKGKSTSKTNQNILIKQSLFNIAVNNAFTTYIHN